MSWVAVCHQCGGEDGPGEAYGEGHNASQAEADAYRKAFEHVRDTGHYAVFVLGGSYWIGEGPRPTEFPRVHPPGEVYDQDGVARELWNEYPEPLNLLLVNVLDLNRDYWLRGHNSRNVRSKTWGAECVRQRGLTDNQVDWADAISTMMGGKHPGYPPIVDEAGLNHKRRRAFKGFRRLFVDGRKPPSRVLRESRRDSA